MEFIIILISICIIAFNVNILTSIEGSLLKGIIIYVGMCLNPVIGIFIFSIYLINWIFNIDIKKIKDKYEYKKRKKIKNKNMIKNNKMNNEGCYFKYCYTEEHLKRRHRELCKIFHPDKGGNPELFNLMQTEYELFKNKFKNIK